MENTPIKSGLSYFQIDPSRMFVKVRTFWDFFCNILKLLKIVLRRATRPTGHPHFFRVGTFYLIGSAKLRSGSYPEKFEKEATAPQKSDKKLRESKNERSLDFDEHSRRIYFKITKIRFYGSVFHALKNVSVKSRNFSDNYSMSLNFLKMTCPGMSS